MIIKIVLPFTIVSAFLWTTMCRVLPERNITQSSPTPWTTPDVGPGCWDSGKFYKPGDYISYHPCYFTQCTEDGIIAGDVFCDVNDECNNESPPNDCCPVCQETTTEESSEPDTPTPDDIPETTPFGCWENDKFYKPGDYISYHPCYFTQCTEDGIIAGDVFCDVNDECNNESPPNDCCPVCQETTIEESSEPDTPTPDDIPETTPFGCWENDKFYKPGDYIYQHPCYSAQCTLDGIIYGDDFCDTNNVCNTERPPTACCPACQVSTTEQWTTTEFQDTSIATDIPTTTQVGCWENGNFYKPGDYIYQHPCYSAQCTLEGIIYGDEFCDTNYVCNTERPPTACCPACPVSTTEQLTTPEFQDTSIATDIPTTTEIGCWENGNFYKPGDFIYQHPCYSAQCTLDGIIYGDEFCDTNYVCNTERPPTDCCPACQDSTTNLPTTTEFQDTTTITDLPTTTPAGCWEFDTFYKPGDYINYNPCYFTMCTEDGIVIGDVFCETEEHCNREIPPNECCPACQETTTTRTTEAITQATTNESVACMDNGRQYKLGEYISYQPCYRIRCTRFGPLHEGTLCQTEARCNLDWPSNDCCPACQETTTAMPDPARRQSHENSIPHGHKGYNYQARNLLRRNLKALNMKKQTDKANKTEFHKTKKPADVAKP